MVWVDLTLPDGDGHLDHDLKVGSPLGTMHRATQLSCVASFALAGAPRCRSISVHPRADFLCLRTALYGPTPLQFPSPNALGQTSAWVCRRLTAESQRYTLALPWFQCYTLRMSTSDTIFPQEGPQ